MGNVSFLKHFPRFQLVLPSSKGYQDAPDIRCHLALRTHLIDHRKYQIVGRE